jgi:transposase
MAWGNTHWGKTILFTDHAEWSTAQIVATYRNGWHVEDTFRDMKQPSWLHWQQQFHWTDNKIRVHALICVLAVLAHLVLALLFFWLKPEEARLCLTTA